MSEPLVSIIVPCYNQEKFISETIQSVINQTYTNWECIIVNDGSSDNSNEVINSLIINNKRIKLLQQENQGVCVARNNGIKNSNGQFILPLDGDDLIDKSYLEKAITYFLNNPDTTLVYCKADRFDKKNKYWNLPKYNYKNEIWNNCIFCSAIYKREDYDKTNGYNVNMKKGLEDWDFWLSLLNENSKVYQIPEILFHYRYQKKSRTTIANKNIRELCKIIYNNHPDIYINYIQDIIFYKNKSEKFEKIEKTLIFRLLKSFYNNIIN